MNVPAPCGRSGRCPESRPDRVLDLRAEAERPKELTGPPAIGVQCAERRLPVHAADPQATGQQPVEARLSQVTLATLMSSRWSSSTHGPAQISHIVRCSSPGY